MAIRVRLSRGRLLAGSVALLVLAAVTVVGLSGGFDSSDARPAQHVAVGKPFAWGPFAITVTGAHSIVTPPAYDGDEAERKLVVTLRVKVTSGHGETTTPFNSVEPEPSALGEDAAQPSVRYLADDRSAFAINPGLVHELGLVWPQDLAWDGSDVALRLGTLFWIEKDTVTGLDDQRWGRLDDPQYVLDIPVERQAS